MIHMKIAPQNFKSFGAHLTTEINTGRNTKSPDVIDRLKNSHTKLELPNSKLDQTFTNLHEILHTLT